MLHGEQYRYRVGMQHRRTGRDDALQREWVPKFETALIVFQNDAGARRWPVTDEVLARER